MGTICAPEPTFMLKEQNAEISGVYSFKQNVFIYFYI